MASKFGNTWWGDAWLNSLSNIDYENRIPRGASYARKGAVKSLKVKDNIIEAKVQGSRRTPYKVMIVLPKFMREDIDRLIDRLLQKPALITELFQRQLSPEIAQIAKDCGLKLFPERWTDLKMNCNCPDWAVPCKHIAAVIYMLSREIDNNPFIVFQMHGVNLIDELKDRGVNLESNQQSIDPMSITALVTKSKPERKRNQTSKEEAKSNKPRVDFTRLPQLSDSNLLLLPDNPPFYIYGNFKEIYTQEMGRCIKGVQRFLNGRLMSEGLFPSTENAPHITADTMIHASIDDTLALSIILNDDGKESAIGLNALAQSLLNINSDFLPDYGPSVGAMHTVVYAAIHLMANNLVKPEIIKIGKNGYVLFWMPLPSDPMVASLVEQISALLPMGTLTASAKGSKSVSNVDNQAYILVSAFIGAIIRSLTILKSNDSVTDLFFRGSIEKFDGIGQKEIPGAIKSWTDRLVLTGDSWLPVLYVADKADEVDGLFSVTISIEGQDTESGGCPLEQVLSSPQWERSRFEILQSVMRLTNVLPGLTQYINDGARNPMFFGEAEFVEFIVNIIPSMRTLGLKVFMPKSLQNLLRPKASLKISEREQALGMFSIFDFFTYNWRISVGDELLDPKEFERMLQRAQGLIKFKKSYIYVSPDDLEKLKSRLRSNISLSPMEIFQAALSEQYETTPVELSNGVRTKLEEIRRYSDIKLPDGLKATLRPYQERGYSWLYRNMNVGFGSILADDMGLGKTLQAITLMLKMKQDGACGNGKMLVVAPVGLLYNWDAEIHRFAPALKTFIYHGPGRQLKDAKNADIVITSYGIIRSDATKIKKSDWRLMVIDEAQNIKNPKAAQSKAVNSIEATYRIALSGTPVENRLSEFWSIMHFVNQGYLGTLTEFTKNYAKPIQVFNDIRCAESLKKITSPFMLRRMKTDKSIISDLPDKIERDVYASLSPQQAALYQQTLSEAMAVIEGMPTDTNEALFKRQGIILQMILALKQICDHPALFLKNGDFASEISGKAQLLIDRVQEIVDANDKVLIFTQYKEMGTILVDIISKHIGQIPLFYHGGCSVNERKEMIDKFQNGRKHQIFILSLKAAGTGLNLTAANNVIHYDLWWNPAVEAQATDRAYRIGQKRNVMIDRFITTGTFEEKINDMINSKRHLAEMTVSTGETWLGNLSNKELHELFDRG